MKTYINLHITLTAIQLKYYLHTLIKYCYDEI